MSTNTPSSTRNLGFDDPAQVFISYAHSDAAVAEIVKRVLDREGVTCWLASRNIHPSDPVEEAINNSIKSCSSVLVVVSRAAEKSPWVTIELKAARAHKKSIIPFVIEEDWTDKGEVSDFKAQIQGIHNALAWEPEKREAVLLEIAKKLKGSRTDIPPLPQEELLWRVAYTFLRLDQLPSGGWGKSLRPWIRRLGFPEPRDRGGLAVTMSAVHVYLEFLHRSMSGMEGAVFRNVQRQVIDFLKGRRGLDGGIDSMGGRVHIHHTLIGLACYLLEARDNPQALRRDDAIMMASYLSRTLARWATEEQENRSMGIVCVAILVLDLISNPALANELCETDSPLKNILKKEILKLTGHIVQEPNPVDPPFFGKDSSLCRSDFIMNLLLTIRDGNLLAPAADDPNLRRHFIEGCSRLLQDVKPYSSEAPHRSLVCSRKGHRPDGGNPDWGLSVGLLSALQIPVLRDGVASNEASGDISKKLRDLSQAIGECLCRCHEPPDVFYFSNGVNIANALHLVSRQRNRQNDIQQLDEKLDDTLSHGATEKRLEDLVGFLVTSSGIDLQTPAIERLKNLMMERLESGEHTPDRRYSPEIWKAEVRNAITETQKFFTDSRGLLNAEKNRERRLSFLATRLSDFADFKRLEPKGKLQAIDIGCGDGLYAEILGEMGFQVYLVDFSKAMLEGARKNLKLKGIRLAGQEKYDIRNLGALVDLQGGKFHVVFAGAVIFHIPKAEVPAVLENCYRLITPGGLLFVNLKIGDHTLIARDGRFFEYYADHEVLAQMLRDVGFEICEIDLREKHHNMYDAQLMTKWANYYCKRPEEGNGS